MISNPEQSQAELSRALALAIATEQNRPDRFPGLATVFNRLPDIARAGLASLSAVKPEISFNGLSVVRLGDVVAAPPLTVSAVVRAEKWNGNVFLLADPVTCLIFVEAATGFDGGSTVAATPRALTPLERRIAALLFARIARGLADAFSAFVDVAFDLEAVGDTELLAGQGADEALTFEGRLRLQFGGKEGTVRVVIPHKLLEPVGSELRAAPALEAKGETTVEGDPEWARQLSDEIARAFITTKAILDERPITLQEISELMVGSTIPLAALSISHARLEIDGRPLFSCELGKMQHQLALRIEEALPEESISEEF